EVGTADAPPGEAQPLERLWRGHLVHQVEIDVDERRPLREPVHHVRVPELLEQRAGNNPVAAAPARWRAGAPSLAACALPSSDHGIIARSFAPTRSSRSSFSFSSCMHSKYARSGE